jgi:hypothetical protein
VTDQGNKLPTIELTSRELHLLLEYGYPFEEQAQTLRASKDRARLPPGKARFVLDRDAAR